MWLAGNSALSERSRIRSDAMEVQERHSAGLELETFTIRWWALRSLNQNN